MEYILYTDQSIRLGVKNYFFLSINIHFYYKKSFLTFFSLMNLENLIKNQSELQLRKKTLRNKNDGKKNESGGKFLLNFCELKNRKFEIVGKMR